MEIFQSPDGRSISLDNIETIQSDYSSVTLRDETAVINFVKKDGLNLTCVARLEVRHERLPVIAGAMIAAAKHLGLDWESVLVYSKEPPEMH